MSRRKVAIKQTEEPVQTEQSAQPQRKRRQVTAEKPVVVAEKTEKPVSNKTKAVSKTSTEASVDISYDFNVYFGIFYPVDFADVILDICGADKKYAGLAHPDKAKIKVGKFNIFVSTNSDFDSATLGFIACDEMTFGSEPEDDPENLSLNFDSAKMELSTKQNKVAVDALTDIYELIVQKFKAKKMTITDLYLGWKGTVCAWELGSDDESDS